LDLYEATNSNEAVTWPANAFLLNVENNAVVRPLNRLVNFRYVLCVVEWMLINVPEESHKKFSKSETPITTNLKVSSIVLKIITVANAFLQSVQSS
jgi:hypothetical protein